MKRYLQSIAILALSFTAVVGCRNGYIDDITTVAATEDTAAPQVTILKPAADESIPFDQTSVDYDFSYTVTDDVEIKTVEVYLDGNKLSAYNSFLDYRIFKNSFTQNLEVGQHEFKIIATDITGKSTTQTFSFKVSNKYEALYPNEVAYFPFYENNVFTDILSGNQPDVVGTPSTVSGGYSNGSYQGAEGSYLTFPLSGLYDSEEGISFTFWYKVNAAPTRAGIITINDNTNDADENRNQGLRIFREGNATEQRIKLNVGTGSGESWNDGAVISATDGSWVHIAVTISKTESKVYFNGVLKNTARYSTPFDFSTSTSMTIGSGAPSFSYWNHKEDASMIDELRVYNKALSEQEVLNTVK